MEKQVHNEYHDNGTLAYTETVFNLPKNTAHLYDNRRVSATGQEWIRVGMCAKYFDNGQLAWVLNYDSNGNLIDEVLKSHRKDGSPIQM